MVKDEDKEASEESDEEVDEKGKATEPMGTYSEQFVDNMVEYFNNENSMLNHVDLSGMSFNGDSLISIATALSGNEMLQGIHLSDNGLR